MLTFLHRWWPRAAGFVFLCMAADREHPAVGVAGCILIVGLVISRRLRELAAK